MSTFVTSWGAERYLPRSSNFLFLCIKRAQGHWFKHVLVTLNMREDLISWMWNKKVEKKCVCSLSSTGFDSCLRVCHLRKYDRLWPVRMTDKKILMWRSIFFFNNSQRWHFQRWNGAKSALACIQDPLLKQLALQVWLPLHAWPLHLWPHFLPPCNAPLLPCASFNVRWHLPPFPRSVGLLPSIRCFSGSAVTLSHASPRRAASREHTVTVKRHVFCKVAADLPQVPPVLTSSFGVSSRLDPDIIKMSVKISQYSWRRRLRWCHHNIFFWLFASMAA